MSECRVGVVAVIRRGDKVLLGRRLKKDGAENLWVFPGGGIDDDGLEEALRRECVEEVGLDVVVGELITATRSAHSGRNNVALIYWATPKHDSDQPLATAEIGEPAFFTVEEAYGLPVMSVTRDVLDRIRPQLAPGPWWRLDRRRASSPALKGRSRRRPGLAVGRSSRRRWGPGQEDVDFDSIVPNAGGDAVALARCYNALDDRGADAMLAAMTSSELDITLAAAACMFGRAVECLSRSDGCDPRRAVRCLHSPLGRGVTMNGRRRRRRLWSRPGFWVAVVEVNLVLAAVLGSRGDWIGVAAAGLAAVLGAVGVVGCIGCQMLLADRRADLWRIHPKWGRPG